MVLYMAYSDAGQFIACMYQTSLVYVSLCKRYESTLSYFWLTLIAIVKVVAVVVVEVVVVEGVVVVNV